MRIPFLFFLCSLHIGLASAETLPRLVFAGDHYPPYSFQRDGEFHGTDIDIIKAVCKEIGVEPVFQFVPWARALRDVRSGGVDAIYSLFRTPEREAFLHYPDNPMGSEKNILVVHASSDRHAERIEDLDGWSIGVVRANSYGKEFDAYPRIRKVSATSNEQLIRMLYASNRVDAIVTNELIFKSLVKEHLQKGVIQETPFRILEYVPNEAPLFVGFSRKRGAVLEQQIGRFDKALGQLRASGEVERIIARYTR